MAPIIWILIFTIFTSFVPASPSLSCSESYFQCSDLKCIPVHWKCDGDSDCSDADDEQDCPVAQCSSEQFRCRSGACIPLDGHCDMSIDCTDGSDEHSGCNYLLDTNNNIYVYYRQHGYAEAARKRICDSFGCENQCELTSNGPECLCGIGYKLNSNGKNCTDIDECSEFVTSPCAHICENLPGQYVCRCRKGYVLGEGGRCHPKIDFDEGLIVFSSPNRIMAIPLETNNYLKLYELDSEGNCEIGDLDMEKVSHYLYFSVICKDSASIQLKPDFKNSSASTLIKEKLKRPIGVAVDSIAKRIYIADSGLRQIMACEITGTPCSVLVDDKTIVQIQNLVLHAKRGLMFWSDWGPNATIYQANMDGTSITRLINNETVHASGLTIDPTKESLYWIDSRNKRIQIYDLSTLQIFSIGLESVRFPKNLAALSNKVYFTSNGGRSIEMTNLHETSYRSTLLRTSKVKTLHLFHPDQTSKRTNPCSENPCPHLCLLSGPGFSCKCYDNFERRNGSSCVLSLGSTIMMSFGKNISYYSIRNREHSPVWSTNETIGCFTYDWSSATIYVYHANREIIAVNFTGKYSNETGRRVFTFNKKMIRGLTYDSQTNNLYWLDPINGLLEIGRSDGRANATLLNRLVRPLDLALDHEKSRIFILTGGLQSKIIQAELDGSNSVDLFSITGPSPTSFFLDEHNTHFYIMSLEDVQKMDFEGNVQSFETPIRPLGTIRDMVIQNETLFMLTCTSSSIHVVERENPLTLFLDECSSQIPEAQLLKVKDEKLSGDCLTNNGGCSHICLYLNNQTECLCPRGYELINSLCKLIPECPNRLYACDNGRTCLKLDQFCDQRVDCEDGSDERLCESQCAKNSDFLCDDGDCISRSWHCDGIADCKDESDEAHCNIE